MTHVSRDRPRRSLLVFAVLALASWCCGSASAQHEGELPATFSSNRPGFANSTQVAAVARLTTELGVTAAFAETPEGALPDLLLRAGVLPWLELRVSAPTAVLVFSSPDAELGVRDPSVGFMIGGALHETVSVSSAWDVSLPLASDGFGAPEATFRADVNLDWRFFGPLTLTPNLVAAVLVDRAPVTGQTRRFFEGGGSLKLTWQVIDLVGLYAQSYALKSEHTDWRVAVGGGVFLRLAPNVQMDASFDASVTEQGIPPTARLGTTVLF